MVTRNYTEALELALGQTIAQKKIEIDELTIKANAIVSDAETRLLTIENQIKERLDLIKDGAEGPRGLQGERGIDGKDGKLPIVKTWQDAVHYEGDVVCHHGGTWQAIKDTGKEPPSDDWVCIASRGLDGLDAREIVIRGTWSDVDDYHALNVVALNGASFIAKTDNPGPCPGSGWQLMSSQGKRGASGERGERGEQGLRGERGASIKSMEVDDTGLVTVDLTDGTSVFCDFAPLAEKIIKAVRV